jgi:hypothetical protein
MPRMDPLTGGLQFEDLDELVELFRTNPEDPWWPDPDPEVEPLHDQELDALVRMIVARSSNRSRSPLPGDNVKVRT